MNNVIHSVDEVDKEAGRVIDALGRLLPAISIGSRRHALKKDAKAYEKARHWLTELDLPETDKDMIIARYQRELLHTDNLGQIAQDAAPQISKASDVNDMDPDWIDDFMGKAEKVSDRDMQRLWSNLLAGEVNDHGTFNKKTLATLYEMDKETARLFNRYCNHAVIRCSDRAEDQDFVVFNPASDRSSKDSIISVAEYQALEDAGLVSQLYTASVLLLPNQRYIYFMSQKDYILFSNTTSKEKTIELHNGVLTNVGQVLCQLCDWGTDPDITGEIKSFLPSGVQMWSVPKTVVNNNEDIRLDDDGTWSITASDSPGD